ncbi:MAG: hypothetical protein ACREHD_03455 [Pirellulales bacterium]
MIEPTAPGCRGIMADMDENPYRPPAEPQARESHGRTGLRREDLSAMLTGAAVILVIVAIAAISELF